MKLQTKIHLSSPTANTFSTSPFSCLDRPESNWEFLANPNKMESRLPRAVVRCLLPIISVFVRAGHVQAQPFNLRTFTLSGDPQPIGEARTFSVSQNGVLAYHESSAESELKLFDRSGNLIGTPGLQAVYSDPRFSPDGKSIAVTQADPRCAAEDIWEPPIAGDPRFSPDGKSIAVTIADPRSGAEDIWVRPIAGGQPPRITFGPCDYWPGR